MQGAAADAMARQLTEAERLLAARDFRAAHAVCMAILRADQREVGAFFVLGLIGAEHDNHLKALELFDRSLALDANHVRAHAHRGKALARLGRVREAEAAAERAAALDPADALTLDTIGVVFSHAGLHERASHFFQRAAEKAPRNANILHNLGVSQQFSGDFDGAERSFRAELALDPGKRRPYAALVNLSKQTRERNFIPQLENQFQAAAGDANARLQVGHSLAKTWEDIGDHERSLAWLVRAKEAKRAELGDVIGPLRAMAEAATAQMPPASQGHGDPRPIFVVGMPRTGTTLVDRILSSHPDVMSAGELADFGAQLHLMTGAPPGREVEMFAAAAKLDMVALGRNYCEAVRSRTGSAPRFVDKMPVNILHAGLVHRALPEARIICLRRHPMDACLSTFRQIFGTEVRHYWYTYDLEDAGAYYAIFDAMVARWRELLPAERFMEVRYEGIVADLETEARRMLAFCGLSWDPRCLDFHENEAPVATASAVQVRAPLYASSVGRWKRYGAALDPLRRALEKAGVAVED